MRVRLAGPYVLLVVGLLVAVLFGLLSVVWAVRVGAIVAVALAAYTAIEETLSRFDAPPARRRRRLPRLRRAPSPPAYFARVERRLELASATADGYEPLRQRLRAIADQRLAGRGTHLDTAAARRLLGDDVAKLLEEAPRHERFARGPSEAQLERVIAALEQL